MKLSREEILQIANLARLQLREDEIENYRNQLSDILAHFTSLQNVDTSNIETNSSSLKNELPFRTDEIIPFKAINKILQVAPHIIENQFVVPPVFEILTTEKSSQGPNNEQSP